MSEPTPTLDMDAINRAVSRQDFTALNKMIVNSQAVGTDIVCLLAMCAMLHSQFKGLREEVAALRQQKLGDPGK